MVQYIIHNGNIIPSGSPVITAENRSFRYGDGIFETIRLANDKILLSEYHFERLFSGIRLLDFEIPESFTPSMLKDQIKALCKKNNHLGAVRIRLVVFRGDGGLFNPENLFPNYIIQSYPLSGDKTGLNEKGLSISIFPAARKSVDSFSNLKSNNYLPYAMGALYARKNFLDDCIILNCFNRICDSTKANIFCIKNKSLFTPPLSEGCVAGVMRRHLMSKLQESGYEVQEKEMNLEFLEKADEIFLTNAISPILWVHSFHDCHFGKEVTSSIYDSIINTIDSE